jgi:hypothetical protein
MGLALCPRSQVVGDNFNVFYLCNSSGSFAVLAAIRRASSRVSIFAAAKRQCRTGDTVSAGTSLATMLSSWVDRLLPATGVRPISCYVPFALGNVRGCGQAAQKDPCLLH